MSSQWLVVKHGVYLHDWFGPFPSKSEAIDYAASLARADSRWGDGKPDGYHVFEVAELRPGAPVDDPVDVVWVGYDLTDPLPGELCVFVDRNRTQTLQVIDPAPEDTP